jgi:thioredoxin reductase (NADPH)
MFDWDVVIIGGGPAGIAAGLYLGRAKYRTLLIEAEGFGGKIRDVAWIENYPGFPEGIAGAKLANAMLEQAEKYGLVTESGRVERIELFSESRWVSCSDGRGYTTSVIIIAGGSRHRKLNVPGEAELTGLGVFNCGFCDGGRYAGKVVAVCGGGDSGLTEALYMSKIAAEVIVLEALPRLTATAILQERARANEKIKVRTGVAVQSILGKEKVEGVTILDSQTRREETIAVDGVLVQIGFEPATEYLAGVIPLDSRGQVIVNEKMQTCYPYLLAAGDIRSGSPCQIASAVGDGVTAAVSAIRYLQGQEG